MGNEARVRGGTGPCERTDALAVCRRRRTIFRRRGRPLTIAAQPRRLHNGQSRFVVLGVNTPHVARRQNTSNN